MRRDIEIDSSLQRSIEAQEQELTALLGRVMEKPLAPLHQDMAELQARVAAIEKAGPELTETITAILFEELDKQAKRFKAGVNETTTGIHSLKDDLSSLSANIEKQHDIDIGNDARTDRQLNQASGLLARIDEQLEVLRKEEQASLDLTRRELNSLGKQVDRHGIRVFEKVEGIFPEITPLLSNLEGKIAASSHQIVQEGNKHTASLQAYVTDVVQQELMRQMASVRTRTTWLIAVCAVSCVSSLGLLGMLLSR